MPSLSVVPNLRPRMFDIGCLDVIFSVTSGFALRGMCSVSGMPNSSCSVTQLSDSYRMAARKPRAASSLLVDLGFIS